MEIISLLKEPVVIVISIVASLFWNVLGNLVTPFFQKQMARFNEKRNQTRVKALLLKRDAVDKLFIQHDERAEVKLDVIVGFLRAIGVMVIGIATLIIGSIFFVPLNYAVYISGGAVWYFGVKVFDEHNLQLIRLRTALEREEALSLWMSENNIAPAEVYKQDEFLMNWDAKKFDIPVEKLRSHVQRGIVNNLI